jgi:CRISPR-associated protein Cst2
MSKHLFGIVCTHHGPAANNRGETEGNITTLQKLLWNGSVHTTVSAEAVRWAIRYWWQMHDLPTNRRWDETSRRHNWQDAEFQNGVEAFIDDDVLGYMSAQAAQQEAEEAEEEEVPAAGRGRARRRARGRADVRRARLEVTRAVSLSPWAGDVTFNAASIGATPSAARQGDFPVPYGAEIHATRYQYGFALTPEDLAVQRRALDVVDAIVGLAEVAGNHARFLYDFSPESVVFRWTDDFAPRMLYGFTDQDGEIGLPSLERCVRAGDIDAAELIIAGLAASGPSGDVLRNLGATIVAGVKEAAAEVKRRMGQDLSLA